MAYQNVGTPRFYIDSLNWRKSIGVDYISENGYNVDGSQNKVIAADLVGLNPSSQSIMHLTGANPDYSYVDYLKAAGDDSIINSDGSLRNFVFVLGHNSAWANCSLHYGADSGDNASGDNIVNCVDGIPPLNGWSLTTDIQFGATVKIYSTPDEITGAQADLKWGSVAYGNYYDMPHSPDLNLTLTREYGGIKTIETRGGASLSNDFGSSPPKWGTREAWQLGDVDFSTGGRRIWDLSFSFLSDSSVFPDNPTEIEDGGGWEDLTTTPDFMSEVVKKTRGSQLPFIFQPDKDNNDPFSGFAICKFDSGFSFQQTAPNLYSVKMKIREVW